MEKEAKYTEETRETDDNATAGMPELTAETIGDRIAEELNKVVGLDQELLAEYIELLGGLKTKEVDGILKTLKSSLGEKLLPLLELMAQHEQFIIAEIGINGLGTVPSFRSAQLLSDINENHPDKKLRKAARKSLYKLKSVGIEVETSHKPLLGESKHERYKAIISPIDGTGTQLIMLTQEMLAGDLHFFQIVASDEEGILECSAKRGMTKKMFARLPETFAQQMGKQELMLAEADYDYAMSLLLEVEEVSENLPDEYLSNKDLFELTDAQIIENPVYQKLDVENLKQQPYFLRTSEELFQNENFLSWHIPVNEMGDYVQQLMDQEDHVLELSPQFQQEQKEDIYQKILDDKLSEAAIKRLQRRLEIMAYIFTEHTHEDEAKKALTAAATIAETPRERLKNHPFVRRLILNSIEAAQYVIEDGYNPEDIDPKGYYLGRDDEGGIMVNFFEREE